MAAIAGRVGRVQVSFDNGATYLNLGGLVDATLNGNVDELETTTHDSGGARSYISNFHDETMDCTMRWDETDAGQSGLLRTVFPSPTEFKVKYRMEVASGKVEFLADAFVTSYSPAMPLDDTASFDISMRLSGTTQSVQP